MIGLEAFLQEGIETISGFKSSWTVLLEKLLLLLFSLSISESRGEHIFFIGKESEMTKEMQLVVMFCQPDTLNWIY